MRKSIVCAVAMAASVLSTAALASADLARRQGCTNCHAAEASNRRMPALSFPELAKKYSATSEDQLVKQLMDGSTNHPRIRSNADQTREIIRWMKTLK